MDKRKYEVLSFDCGGYILLLLHTLLRTKSPSAVASTSEKILISIR